MKECKGEEKKGTCQRRPWMQGDKGKKGSKLKVNDEPRRVTAEKTERKRWSVSFASYHPYDSFMLPNTRSHKMYFNSLFQLGCTPPCLLPLHISPALNPPSLLKPMAPQSLTTGGSVILP